MTRARLLSIKEELENHGVVILAENGLFYVDSQVIEWKLLKGSQVLSLNFSLFEDFGGFTDDIRDISWASVSDRDIEMFFEKISSQEWNIELSDFVKKIKREFTEPLKRMDIDFSGGDNKGRIPINLELARDIGLELCDGIQALLCAEDYEVIAEIRFFNDKWFAIPDYSTIKDSK